jgi:hypothetical protein
VVDVSVNGTWYSNQVSLAVVLKQVLRSNGAVGHGVGGTNHHESSKVVLLANLVKLLELSLGS